MKVYDLGLDLPWFKARNPEIDWTRGRLTALRTPNGPQRAKIPEAYRTSPLPERGEENTNDEPPPDIQLLGTTAFGHLLASEEVVEAFPIYDLENVNGCWEHLWKASPKVRESPGC